MTTFLWIIGLIGGGGGIAVFLIKLFADSQKNAGKLEERNDEQQKTIEATKRADDVLAEHRDPDDGSTVERLRRHDF